jgi:hypothetical protein
VTSVDSAGPASTDSGQSDKQLTMPINQTPTGKPCQHALSVSSNVIVDVSACSQDTKTQAAQIAQKIEGRFPH